MSAPTNEDTTNRSQSLWLVITLALFVTLPWLERPFYSRGEPREALVAQSRLHTGNWISPPAYNGAVPSKPPFSHWLISLVSLPGGEVTEFTSRLPTAVAFILFSGAFYLFLARRVSSQSALVSSLILLGCAEWFRAGVSCRVDTILSTSLAGALLALFSWQERGRRGFPLLAALLISVAALTKGPIGVALPLAIFGLYELLVGEKSIRNVFRIGFRCAGIALPVIAVVSLWYIAGYLQRGDEFIDKIYYENFARLTSSMEDEPHKHSAFYLLGMLMVGVLPWTIPWLTSAVPAVRRIQGVRHGVVSRWRSATNLQRFSCVAAMFIFLFFCVPSSKRSVYILPAYPFIAFLAGELVVAWGVGQAKLLRVISSVIVWFAASVVIVACVGMVVPFRPELSGLSRSLLESLSPLRVGTLVVLSVVLGRRVRELEMKEPVQRLSFSLIGAVVVLSLVVVEPILYQMSPKRWLSSASFQQSVDLAKYEKFYSFGSESYASSFYLQKPFYTATAAGVPAGSLVFVEQRNIERLKSEVAPHVKEVARFSSGIEGAKKALVVVEVLP
jgi:4-amino-4-deoxy-L-arabinose transferase-like glycosyltransferase